MKNCKYRNRLREWRANAGLSLAEVAGLVGLSDSMVSYLERGERNLSPKSKIAVARRLGVSVRELFPISSLATRGKKAAR